MIVPDKETQDILDETERLLNQSAFLVHKMQKKAWRLRLRNLTRTSIKVCFAGILVVGYMSLAAKIWPWIWIAFYHIFK